MKELQTEDDATDSILQRAMNWRVTSKLRDFYWLDNLMREITVLPFLFYLETLLLERTV